MTRKLAVILLVCLVGAGAALAQDEAPKRPRIIEPVDGTVVPQGSILYVQAEVPPLGAGSIVRLEVDYATAATKRYAPYVLRWDSTRAAVGRHEMRVVGRDVRDHETASEAIHITVGPRAWTLPAAPAGEPLADATWNQLLAMAQDTESDLRLRHLRLGLVDNVPGQPVVHEDPLSGTPDPRAPLLTGTYLGACAYAYATTRDPEAKDNAADEQQALHMLSAATGTSGMIGRWFRQATSPTPDETQAGLLGWNQNGAYRWLGGAGPLDYAGVFFGHALYYDLVADPQDRASVALDVFSLGNRLLRNRLVITDPDGLPVPDGNLSPDGLSQPYDAILALGFFKIASHVTGKQQFEDQYQRLIRDNAYHEKGLKPADIAPEKWGDYEDYAVMLMYCCLLEYETDPAIRESYRKGVEAIYRSNADLARTSPLARRPLFNIIYGRFNPDAGVGPQAVEWLLDSRSPLGDSERLLANWMGRYYQIIR